MARSALTLAALATAAVAGLDVTHARMWSTGASGEYDSALLTVRGGRELIIRVPTSQAAETEQATDLVALRALTTGTRSRLPFDVPSSAGQAPVDGTRAVVYGFLPGRQVGVDDVTAGSALPASIGRALAAIHALPAGFVGEAGLPVLSAAESHASTAALIDQTAATGMLPAALRARWRDATGDAAVWQFQPAVINGALTAESLLVEGESISGVLGWSALRVGDPARDLHWLLGMAPDAAEEALAAYGAARQITTDRQFTQRAMLYAELEIARWLLHGRQVHDDRIVDDAVQMLDSLVDRVHGDSMGELGTETGPILAVGEVESLLEQSPRSSGDDEVDGLRPREELGGTAAFEFGDLSGNDDADADADQRDRAGDAGTVDGAGEEPVDDDSDAAYAGDRAFADDSGGSGDRGEADRGDAGGRRIF